MGILNAFGIVNVQEDADRYFDRLNKQAMQDDIRHLTGTVLELEENMLRISDAFDSIGWSPLPEDQAAEIPLKTVKKVAEVARAMNAMNPFVKRGVSARIAYVWGKGVTFDGIDAVEDEFDLNRKKLFSPQAFEEFERVLATDGNAFTALSIAEDEEDTTAFRITLDEIDGAVSNPLDKEEVWYYKRCYTVNKTNSQTGEVTKETYNKYYASLGYYQKLQKQGKNLPRRWNKFGVEQNFVIQHVTVNKQVGWRWGVPDIMPVIFWAKAYKEYLEDNAMLVKAYSRLAWQMKASTAAGGAALATQVMAPPTRDPMTGELRSVGGTGITGMGTELTPIAATGSSVDFTKGDALAAAIAAGLEVSKVVILSDSGSSNRAAESSLDLPTLKAMESRQQLHTERFLEVFEFWGAEITPPRNKSRTIGGKDASDKKPKTKLSSIQEAKAESGAEGIDYAIVTWPQIETDTTKDRIAALGTAVELGILFKQEARKEAIDVFGIAPYKPWDDLPTMEDDPAAAEKAEQEAVNAEREAANAASLVEKSAIAKQGVSGGVAAKGGSQTSNNAARDARASDKNNS